MLELARALSVVSFPAWSIDRHGVGAADQEALRRALEGVRPHSGCVLADGNLKLGPGVECLPRADSKSAAVAAASVVAKVLRDGAMPALAREHPGYGFEHKPGVRNAGASQGSRGGWALPGASPELLWGCLI